MRKNTEPATIAKAILDKWALCQFFEDDVGYYPYHKDKEDQLEELTTLLKDVLKPILKTDKNMESLQESHDLLLTNLKNLVKCIRNFELGDFGPLMDEIFDSEHAIKKAKKFRKI